LNYNPECSSDVPKKEWKKWSLAQQLIFNYLYETMMDNQKLFKHPKDVIVDEKLWKTTAHNAAWEATSGYQYFKDQMEKYKIV